MKPIECFNGAVTSVLHNLGLDSVKVLNAVNSWVGEINHGEGKDDTIKVSTGAKVSGMVTKKAGDKRIVTITESEKRVAKRAWTWQGALYALSTACDDMVARHGVCIEVTELPAEVREKVCRPSFEAQREPIPEPAPTTVPA